jgi:hypothetical protein
MSERLFAALIGLIILIVTGIGHTIRAAFS